MARKQPEVRWTVFKDYYDEDGERFTDSWVILYGTRQEADAAMERQKTGYDKSWFDPAGNDYAGHDAILYVDQIQI